MNFFSAGGQQFFMLAKQFERRHYFVSQSHRAWNNHSSRKTLVLLNPLGSAMTRRSVIKSNRDKWMKKGRKKIQFPPKGSRSERIKVLGDLMIVRTRR